MSKIARIYQGINEIQKYYQGGVLQRLFFDWKHYIGNELNIEYAKECAGRNVVISGKTYQNLIKPTSFTVNAPCTLFGVKSNTIYTIVIKNNSNTNKQLNYAFYNGTSRYNDNALIKSNSNIGIYKKIITTKRDTTDLYLYFVANSDGETMDTSYKNVIILEGDYTNIDLPTSIDGIESVAERENINLLKNVEWYDGFINLNTGEVETSTSYPKAKYSELIEINSNQLYKTNITEHINGLRIRLYKADGSFIRNSGTLYSFNGLYQSGNNYFSKIRLLALNAEQYPLPITPYVIANDENINYPYPLKLKVNEKINPINLPIPLRSLPNGVCDTIEGNKLIQRVGKIMLDESNASNFNQVNDKQVFRWSHFFDTQEFVSGICDNFPIKNVEVLGNENKGVRLSNAFKGIDIKLPDDTGFDTNAFRTWLSENPVTVYYELATPIETEITPNMILINGEPITDTVGIELPNGTCDSIENDYYVKRVGKVIIDGKNGTYQRSGTSTSTLDVYVVRYLGINITLKGMNTNYIYQCDSKIDMSKYITVGKWLSDKTSGSVVFKVPTEEYLWSDIFNAFLENPITLYVELATPVKIPLFSIKEGLTILKSTNNITPQIELDCLVRNDFQNMCDNEWERGDIVYGTGAIDDTNSRRIRLINYIKVKSNTTYKIDITNLVQGSAIALRCYDISKTYIFSGSGAIGKISKAPLYFTTPEDCYYIRFIAETKDINFKIYLKEVIN